MNPKIYDDTTMSIARLIREGEVLAKRGYPGDWEAALTNYSVAFERTSRHALWHRLYPTRFRPTDRPSARDRYDEIVVWAKGTREEPFLTAEVVAELAIEGGRARHRPLPRVERATLRRANEAAHALFRLTFGVEVPFVSTLVDPRWLAEPVIEIEFEDGWNEIERAVFERLRLDLDEAEREIWELLGAFMLDDEIDYVKLRSSLGAWPKTLALVNDYCESTNTIRGQIVAEATYTASRCMKRLVTTEAAAMRMRFGEGVALARDTSLAYLSIVVLLDCYNDGSGPASAA